MRVPVPSVADYRGYHAAPDATPAHGVLYRAWLAVDHALVSAVYEVDAVTGYPVDPDLRTRIDSAVLEQAKGLLQQAESLSAGLPALGSASIDGVSWTAASVTADPYAVPDGGLCAAAADLLAGIRRRVYVT